MKRFLIFAVTAALLAPSLSAQIHLFLEEQQVTVPDGKATGWVFPVNHDLDEALDDVKDYFKDRSDLKMKKGGENVLIAEKVSLPAISTLRGDLIAMARITEQNYSMALVYKLGYDISVESEQWPDESENLRNYAKSYMTYHYEQHYARILKDLEKQLKDLEKKKKQDEGKVTSMTNKINNLSKKIAKETETEKINALEAEINTLESDIRTIMDTMDWQDAAIAGMKKEIDRNRSESNSYLAAIAGF